MRTCIGPAGPGMWRSSTQPTGTGLAGRRLAFRLARTWTASPSPAAMDAKAALIRSASSVCIEAISLTQRNVERAALRRIPMSQWPRQRVGPGTPQAYK